MHEVDAEVKYLENIVEGILPNALFYDVFKSPFHISIFICVNSSNIKRKLEKLRFMVSNYIVFWHLLTDIGGCFFLKRLWV
jgi:hypothetical protein